MHKSLEMITVDSVYVLRAEKVEFTHKPLSSVYFHHLV